MSQIGYELSPLGQDMMERKVSQDVIFRTPRAVDALQVILTKGE
jgi:hypothetical protein